MINVPPDLIPGLALFALALAVILTVLLMRWVFPPKKRDRMKELD